MNIISILGITKAQMDDGNEAQAPLSTILLEAVEIICIEQTPATNDIGKWHIMYHKKEADKEKTDRK